LNSTPKRPTHLDDAGNAHMVDVGAKEVTRRRAVASGRVIMAAETLATIDEKRAAKGDVLSVARIAAIQTAKETARWIPLCHTLPLDSISVDFTLGDFEGAGGCGVKVRVEACTSARTGVEMEALTGVSAALLTIYDMLKAIDRGMEISSVRLEEKEGGRSGHWKRSD